MYIKGNKPYKILMFYYIVLYFSIFSYLGHNSEPCGYFRTILRHKLAIILPELPIPTRSLNASVQPEFLNPTVLYKDPLLCIKSHIGLYFGVCLEGILGYLWRVFGGMFGG